MHDILSYVRCVIYRNEYFKSILKLYLHAGSIFEEFNESLFKVYLRKKK